MEKCVVLDLVDMSDLLKPGVYLLSFHSRVVYVGRAKRLLPTIAMHWTVSHGPALPDWFPTKRVTFDDITVYPMSYDLTLPLAQALIEFHRPSANLKPASSPPEPFLAATHIEVRGAAQTLRRI